MVRRGWRNLLYLKYTTAKAKAKRPLHLEKAAPSGTIENVGCELPPETKRRNLHSDIKNFFRIFDVNDIENNFRIAFSFYFFRRLIFDPADTSEDFYRLFYLFQQYMTRLLITIR